VRPCDRGSSRVALATSCREDPVQVVLPGTQVASRTHARVYIGLADISQRCASAICSACVVVWQPRRPADTSTNQRHGFLCRRTASMEHGGGVQYEYASYSYSRESMCRRMSHPLRQQSVVEPRQNKVQRMIFPGRQFVDISASVSHSFLPRDAMLARY